MRKQLFVLTGLAALALCAGAVAEAPEDDSVLDDDAGVPAGGADAPSHVHETLVSAAGRDVSPCDRPRRPRRHLRPLARQPERAPVLLAGDVVVHAVEPESLEPHRGSWAEVSLVVVAVDDDRPVARELPGRTLVELGDGNRLDALADGDHGRRPDLRAAAEPRGKGERRVPCG